jgi:hypothetical protein
MIARKYNKTWKVGVSESALPFQDLVLLQKMVEHVAHTCNANYAGVIGRRITA